MKVLFSQIKELVPELKADPKEIAEVLTYIGFMRDSISEVNYKGAKDHLISLEIRQNRPDCLAVIGIAREIAAYYKLKTIIPDLNKINYTERKINVDIEAKNEVRRVLAVEIINIKNQESPDWLKEFLGFYEINQVNLLVDLSNYVMILTGYPSHLLDGDLITGKIIWSINSQYNKISTLLGTEIELNQEGELLIQDESNVLALAGIVGAKKAEISLKTKNIFLELAVYDRAVVRRNSRSLNIVTDASNYLEKDLDPQGVDYAMSLLINLILEYCGGNINSSLFDFYLNKKILKPISMRLEAPSIFTGIEIPSNEVRDILKNLNFQVEEKNKEMILVTPPSYRTDISVEEDLVEEVARIYDYRKIPTNILPKLEVVANITPKNIILADELREFTTSLSFDEVLSLPLTGINKNKNAKYLDWNIVSTQNSVNENFPELRISMSIGLFSQYKEYIKKNLSLIEIFEIGKIFGEKEGKYVEQEMIGLLYSSLEDKINIFKARIEKILRYSGFNQIEFIKSDKAPRDANPNSCWWIHANGHNLGILYKYRPQEEKINVYFSEFNITQMTLLLPEIENNPVVEINNKLVSLDRNIELKKEDSIHDYLRVIKDKIKSEYTWSVNVIDVYEMVDIIRYTIRVVYMNLSDQEAKKIHSIVFDA